MHLLITKSIKRNIQLSKVYTGEQLNNTGACWTVNLVFWIFTIKIFVAHICEAVSVRLARFYSHRSLQAEYYYWFHSAQAFPWQLVTMGWSSSSMTITPTTNNGLQASSIFNLCPVYDVSGLQNLLLLLSCYLLAVTIKSHLQILHCMGPSMWFTGFSLKENHLLPLILASNWPLLSAVPLSLADNCSHLWATVTSSQYYSLPSKLSLSAKLRFFFFL